MRKKYKVSEKKKDYAETLNEIFETDIDWTKLSLTDLEKLTNILSDSSKVIKILLKLVDIEELIEVLITKVIVVQVKKSKTFTKAINLIRFLKNEAVEKL